MSSKKALISLCIGAMIGLSPAVAQVPDDVVIAYNQAIGSGDPASIRSAAVALGEAAIMQRADPDAATMAYEAAWQLCRLEQCTEAIAFAQFAVDEPGGEDALPRAHRELLLAYASWRAEDSRKTRKQLDKALEAATNSPPSPMTIVAFWKRVEHDAVQGDNRSLMNTAAQAVAHFEPIRDIAFEMWSGAELLRITATFNERQSLETATDMAELQDALKVFRNGRMSEGEIVPDWWERSYYTADAWRLAIGAYFESVNERRYDPDAVAAILERTEWMPEPGQASDGARPFCKGRLIQKPELRYNTRALRKGMFGAVIVRFGVEGGQIVEPEVLASVPQGGFDEDVISRVSQWTYEFASPDANCRRSRSNIILPTIFQIAQ